MNNKILVAGGTLAGLAVGAVGGYILAKTRYERAFVEALKDAVDEEVAAVEQHFKVLNKRDEYSSPEEVLARRTPKIPEGLEDTPAPPLDEPSVEELESTLEKLKYWRDNDSIIANTPSPQVMGQPEQAVLRPRLRPNDPYQILEEAFFQGEEGYEQVSLVWYAGDPEPTLAGADDDVAYEPHYAIGKELKLDDFDGQAVIYFRNPRISTDFEVNLSELSYSEFVTGAEPKAS